MLISLHLPKTAGSSFKMTWQDYYKDKVQFDYVDLPLQTKKSLRQCSAAYAFTQNIFTKHSEIECIHGHFLPVKYKALAVRNDVIFITWMRNPVERLLSHYYFWIRTYDKDRADTCGQGW